MESSMEGPQKIKNRTTDAGLLILSSCPGVVDDERARPGVKSKASAKFIMVGGT
jgi:hypothetical protein